MGGRARRLAELGWSEWRHAVAIFGACAFAAWGLERLGYRLTMAVVVAFLCWPWSARAGRSGSRSRW